MAYAKLYFLLPVRFCGHPAFTVCPLLWTPRLYCLSTFVDTTLFTACPVLRTPCFYRLSTFADTTLFTACPVLRTPRFYRLSTFVDTALLPSVHFCGHRAFTVCPVLRTLPIQDNAKFRYYGIFNGATLGVNDGLLPNILVFTPNFSIRRQSEIPEYRDFYSAIS